MILARHPRVRIHYTPTYSSWLNQLVLTAGRFLAAGPDRIHALLDLTAHPRDSAVFRSPSPRKEPAMFEANLNCEIEPGTIRTGLAARLH